MELYELLELFSSGRRDMDPRSCVTLRELLNRRASEKDEEISSLLLKQLVERYAAVERELKAKQTQLLEDLYAAGEIQRALLPKLQPRSACCTFSWRFIPCDRVGGDIFNVFSVGQGKLCFYILDVSGHGVPSAMLAVLAQQAMQPTNRAFFLSEEGLPSPKVLLEELDREFPLERFERHFTMTFAALDERNGRLLHAGAGHPPSLLQRKDGRVELLEVGGPIIGLGGMLPFTEQSVTLFPGDRLLLYTDGVTECENLEKGFFGDERLVRHMQTHADNPMDEMLESLAATLNDYCGNAHNDDISLLSLEYHGAR